MSRPQPSPDDPYETSDHTAPKTGKGLGSLDLLALIHSKQLSPKNLHGSARLLLIEHLTAEGVTSAQIASLLKITERTVQRDRKKLRAHYASELDPCTFQERLGELLADADRCVQNLRGMAREKDVDPAVRQRCYEKVHTIRLRTLRFLQDVRAPASGPSGPAHPTDNCEHELAALLKELSSLRDLTPLTPEARRRLRDLEGAARLLDTRGAEGAAETPPSSPDQADALPPDEAP